MCPEFLDKFTNNLWIKKTLVLLNVTGDNVKLAVISIKILIYGREIIIMGVKKSCSLIKGECLIKY